MEGKDLFKPFRFRMAGDEQPPARYHAFARRLMQRARQTAAVVGGGIWAQKETLDDGTILHATLVGGIDTVWVTPAVRRVEAIEEGQIKVPSRTEGRFWASVRYNWALPVLFGPSADMQWPESGPEAVPVYDIATPGVDLNHYTSTQAAVNYNFQIRGGNTDPVTRFLGSSHYISHSTYANDREVASEFGEVQGYVTQTLTESIAGFLFQVSRTLPDVIHRIELGEEYSEDIQYADQVHPVSAYMDYWEELTATGYGYNPSGHYPVAALTADLENFLFVPMQDFTNSKYYRLQWLGDDYWETLVTHSNTAQAANVRFVLYRNTEMYRSYTLGELGGAYSTSTVAYAGDYNTAGWLAAQDEVPRLRLAAYVHAHMCTGFFPFAYPVADGTPGYVFSMQHTHPIETGFDVYDSPNLGYLKFRNTFGGYTTICTEEGLFWICDFQIYGPSLWVLDRGVYFFPAKDVQDGHVVLDWEDVCLLQPLPAGAGNDRFEHATLSVLEREGRKFVALWFAYDYSIYDLTAYTKYLRDNPTGPQQAKKWMTIEGNLWWWLPPGEIEFELPRYGKEQLFVWHTNANITNSGYVPKKNYLPEWMHAFY